MLVRFTVYFFQCTRFKSSLIQTAPAYLAFLICSLRYHGLLPWNLYSIFPLPTGHCMAWISIRHLPSPFSARSRAPVIGTKQIFYSIYQIVSFNQTLGCLRKTPSSEFCGDSRVSGLTRLFIKEPKQFNNMQHRHTFKYKIQLFKYNS